MADVILLIFNYLLCQVYLRISSVFIGLNFLIFWLHFLTLLVKLYKLLIFAFDLDSVMFNSSSHSIILFF